MRWIPLRRGPARDREEQAAAEALRERARRLPRERVPERDLWPGIRNRIEIGEAPARARLLCLRLRVPVWAAAAVALVLVATTVGTGLWLGAPGPGDDAASARMLADALRDRDGMGGLREDLLELIESRRAQLPPEVVAAVERNLTEIDRAIAEIHLAFQEHPDNTALHFLLAEAYRREAEMLQQLEGWTTALVPEAQS